MQILIKENYLFKCRYIQKCRALKTYFLLFLHFTFFHKFIFRFFQYKLNSRYHTSFMIFDQRHQFSKHCCSSFDKLTQHLYHGWGAVVFQEPEPSRLFPPDWRRSRINIAQEIKKNQCKDKVRLGQTHFCALYIKL